MRTIKQKLLLLVCALVTVTLKAQVPSQLVYPTHEWSKYPTSRWSFKNNASSSDASNNICITGGGAVGSHLDAIVSKHDSLGNSVFLTNYDNSGGMEEGLDLVIDPLQNIYVCGYTQNGQKDFLVLAYDPAGNLLWDYIYDVNGFDDEAVSISYDPVYNVLHVTGYSTTGNGDKNIHTLCLDAGGSYVWSSDFDGSSSLDDFATDVQISSDGLICYVTGMRTESAGEDIAILSYDAANGSLNWDLAIDGPSSGSDIGKAMTLSGANVVIAGAVYDISSRMNYATLKIDGSNGSVLWDTYYDFQGYDDIASGLVKDSVGNICVSGYAINSSGIYEYHTILYDSLGGGIWLNTESTNATSLNAEPRIAMDTVVNSFYICGEIENSNKDVFVYHIDNWGNTQWRKSLQGMASGIDAGTDIAVSSWGDIYVSANTQNWSNGYDITAIKISQTPYYYPIDFNTEPPAGTFLFNENLGQIADMSGQPVNSVKYYTNSGQELYFHNNKLSYVFSKIDTTVSTPDTTVRIELEMYKSNINAEPYAFEEKHGTLNYYLPHCSSGITGVRGFQRLLIPNIYPSIDLHYYSNQNGLKYYFVVKPGGNPNDILLRYNGATTSTVTMAGELYVNNTIGQIYQDQPTAYQIDWNLNVIPVTGFNYVNAGTHTYSFSAATYTTSLPLLIQLDQGNAPISSAAAIPEWSTFFGGSGDDRANEITTDANGNLYATGTTKSSNFPVLGMNSGSLTGGQDAFVVKFDNNYARIWASYIGGNNLEEGFGITYDDANNKVYVCGATSSTNLPLQALATNTASSYVENTNISDKGFLLRMNESNGDREWLTKFGFADVGNGNKIKTDASGNIYVIGNINAFQSFQVSCTTPTNGSLPLCNPGGGAYFQTVHASAAFGTSGSGLALTDGYIAKFSSSTQLTWCTLFGGNGDEFMYNLHVDKNNQKLYVVGGTRSQNLSAATCSAATDGRFPLCNPTGSYFQQAINGNNSSNKSDGFISKFSLNGSMEWSTYFGGNNSDAITDLATDNNGNAFITGYTQTSFYGPNCQPSGTGFPLCASGYTQAFGGFMDMFIAKLSTTGSLLWSTFYGGGAEEGLIVGSQPKIAINLLNNDVYIGGTTNSCSNLNTVSNSSLYNQNKHADDSYAPGTCTLTPNSATDGLLAGFTNSGSIVYSSFFGGRGVKGTSLGEGDILRGLATYQNRVYACGVSYSTLSYPFNCPSTTNPYCDNTYSSVSPSQSTAFFAQLTNTVVGIKEYSNDKRNYQTIKIYPNPSNSIINLEWQGQNSKMTEISLYNSIGQMVYKVLANETHGLNTQTINVANLSHGVYIAVIKTESQLLNAKFIKE